MCVQRRVELWKPYYIDSTHAQIYIYIYMNACVDPVFKIPGEENGSKPELLSAVAKPLEERKKVILQLQLQLMMMMIQSNSGCREAKSLHLSTTKSKAMNHKHVEYVCTCFTHGGSISSVPREVACSISCGARMSKSPFPFDDVQYEYKL